MTITFAAKSLFVNGERMLGNHSKEAIADHLKAVLFGVQSKQCLSNANKGQDKELKVQH